MLFVPVPAHYLMQKNILMVGSEPKRFTYQATRPALKNCKPILISSQSIPLIFFFFSSRLVGITACRWKCISSGDVMHYCKLVTLRSDNTVKMYMVPKQKLMIWMPHLWPRWVFCMSGLEKNSPFNQYNSSLLMNPFCAL